MNYNINPKSHEGNPPETLLRFNGNPGCFDGVVHLICIIGSDETHLPLDNTLYILHGVQVIQVC